MPPKADGYEPNQSNNPGDKSNNPGAVAEYFKRRHPVKTRECVAFDLNVNVKTVDRWLHGEEPTYRHFKKMAKTYGLPFLREVFPDELASIKMNEETKFKLDTVPALIPNTPGLAIPNQPNWKRFSALAILAARLFRPGHSEYMWLAKSIRHLIDVKLSATSALPAQKQEWYISRLTLLKKLLKTIEDTYAIEGTPLVSNPPLSIESSLPKDRPPSG